MMKPLNILLIGFGSIGHRYFHLIKKIFSHEIWLLRHKKIKIPEYLKPSREEFEFYSWDEIKKNGINFNVAMICNPTYLHIKTALKCVEMGIKNLWIEKPVNCSLAGLDKLINLCRKKNVATYVAYPFRFNKAIKEIKNKIDSTVAKGWTPFEYIIFCSTDISKWYPDGRTRTMAEGGGPLFELSHELDIVQYLFGDYSMFATTYLNESTKTKGQIIIKTRHNNRTDGVIFLDTDGQETKRAICIPPGIKTEYSISDDDYLNQLKYFFENLGNPNMMNNINEASELFKKIMEIRGQ